MSGGPDAPSAIRPLVMSSWVRCRTSGVDPQSGQAPVALSAEALRSEREASPLAAAMPVIRGLLADPAGDAGHVVAVGDAAGRLLWVEGDPEMRSKAAGMGFAEGALWTESVAGTNAPGTALALDAPVQIFATEHYLEVAHHWSCVAAPVHDPSTGRQIGVIDVTGDDQVAGPQALALLRSAVAAVESELARAEVPRPGSQGHPWRAEFLGRDNAVLTRGEKRTVLSARHSELLLLLVCHPAGLTADRIGVLLHEHEVPGVTIRAELARLRRILGPDALGSRPYRLLMPISADIVDVRTALDQGDVGQAMAAYDGALMPQSESPAIRDLRDEMRARVRRAALAAGDPQALLDYAGTDDGSTDLDVLQAAVAALPRQSARRADVEARIHHLDRLFA